MQRDHQHPLRREDPTVPTSKNDRSRSKRTAPRVPKRVVGEEGQARTPFADSAVTTRSPKSSGG